MLDEAIFDKMSFVYRNYQELSIDFLDFFKEKGKKISEVRIKQIEEPGLYHLVFLDEFQIQVSEANILYESGMITGLFGYGDDVNDIIAFEVLNKKLRIDNLIKNFEKYIKVNFSINIQ